MMSLDFDVIAFDLDGTLADTAPDLAAALNHVLAHTDRPALSEFAVRGLIGQGVQTLVRKGLATTGDAPDELVDRGVALFMDYYSAHICEETRPYAGAREALDALDALGAKLAICTNKPEGLAVKLTEALGWSSRFASIVGGDSLRSRKPDPASLQAAIARAGGGCAAFVGDSITDAATARAARIPLVAVSFGYSDRPIGELGADLVIDEFRALIPALRRLATSDPSEERRT